MPVESRQSRIKFISLVKKYPCLYNVYIPEYSDRNKINQAWDLISHETGLTIEQCKMKWKNLRRCFVRGLRPRSNGIFRPAPAYVQKNLEFILPFIKTHIVEESNNFKSDNLPFVDNQSDTESFDNFESKPQRFTNEGRTLDDVDITSEQLPETPKFDINYTIENGLTENQMQSSENEGSQPSINDEVDPSRKLFLLSLLPEIDALTPNQFRSFRKKVIEALDIAANETIASSSRFTIIKQENEIDYLL